VFVLVPGKIRSSRGYFPFPPGAAVPFLEALPLTLEPARRGYGGVLRLLLLGPGKARPPNEFWCKFRAIEAQNSCLVTTEFVFVTDEIVQFFNFGENFIVYEEIPPARCLK